MKMRSAFHSSVFSETLKTIFLSIVELFRVFGLCDNQILKEVKPIKIDLLHSQKFHKRLTKIVLFIKILCNVQVHKLVILAILHNTRVLYRSRTIEI